jgi:hypothetical protein
MITRSIFKQQSLCLFFLLVTSLAFPGFISISMQNTEIILHDEQLPITPKEFYIANVTDERDDRTAIGWLLPAEGLNQGTKTYPVDLQGGGFAAIKQYIEHSLPRNTSLRPVIAGLKKCLVTETLREGGLVEGKVSVILSFYLQLADTTEQLVDYNGKAIYTRNAGSPQDIEPTLRHVLGNGLIYLNTWMNKRAGIDIKLAKTVAVTFTDYTESPEGDTIYYAANRPLTWDDFKSKIGSAKFAAEVYPTMGYNEQTKIDKGVVKLNLSIKVCLPKSACWVKDGERSDYILNHEQRHFDIARIAAEHFKQRIKAETLTVQNYDGPINVDYLDAYREMTGMELQYDKETSHGQDKFMQEKWNEKIDSELKVVTRD